tara:strand:- start:393 stop:671 length:279 start_codon:yes stop_codon:yes gene_type:complete
MGWMAALALWWAALDRAERLRLRILKFFSRSIARCSGVIIRYILEFGVVLSYQVCGSPVNGQCVIHDGQIWVSAERAMDCHRLSEGPRAQID